MALVLSSNLDHCLDTYYGPIERAKMIFKGNYSFGKCGGCFTGYVGYGANQFCKCYPIDYVQRCNKDPVCKIDEGTGICWVKT